MTAEYLIKKATTGYEVTEAESFELSSLTLSALIYAADIIRQRKHPDSIVSYIIDRNINITNVCFSFCEFCNFCKTSSDADSYITTSDQYRQKIEELFAAGGNQVLLQGGMHPELGLDFYTGLFNQLKTMFPDVYLHALSPSEIVFLSQKEHIPLHDILIRLKEAGLDSLPGGGAEILVDRVREQLSPLKATADQWLDVMRQAHKINLSTTATMMFGHIETPEERIEHLLKIRSLQNETGNSGSGFISFIPWTFQPGNTRLARKHQRDYKVSVHDYIKMIAISRIVLHNIPNIQASWLTVGKETASLALHAGANDLGSIMLEENVVASTGVHGRLSVSEMETLIRRSGFIPAKRNQRFEVV
jgi:cyclic dehypoxanthinyl futalosine synthase